MVGMVWWLYCDVDGCCGIVIGYSHCGIDGWIAMLRVVVVWYMRW